MKIRHFDFARRRCGLLLVGLLLLCTTVHVTQASAWSWSFSSTTTSSENEDDKEDESIIVSPLVNRQLETAVKAHHWPSTAQNVFCEAAAFFAANDKEYFAFLDRLVDLLEKQDDETLLEDSNDPTYQSARDLVLKAVLDKDTFSSSSTVKGLFQVALALRSASPLCETHRQLARQTWERQQSTVTAGSEAASSPSYASHNVMAVVHPGEKVLSPTDLDTLDWSSIIMTAVAGNSETMIPTSWDDYLLPDEHARTYPDRGDQNNMLHQQQQHLVILYANMGTTDFVRVYRKLVAQKVPFVVRHLGAIHFEEGIGGAATPTTLQGYGVRVDIRNVEYKVFDDRRDTKAASTGALNLTAHPEQMPGDLLAGVNVQALGVTDDIKLALWQTHEQQQAQSQKVPPVWQRRQLPLQAATVISQAAAQNKDPLATLTQVSQNLPSLASLLVHVKIPEEIQQTAELLEQDRNIVPGRLYVNGRKVLLDLPSFNIFEILNVMRQEEQALQRLQDTLSPYFENVEALRIIQDAWMQGQDFDAIESDDASSPIGGSSATDKAIRINVGRGWKNAVVYLNDVEKDIQYARWPRSVMGMIQSMQYGMPPAVRRNMFTILAVIDPLENPAVNVFQLGMQLVQNSYPARVGVLWVNQEDIDECRHWLQSQESLEDDTPCPTKPIFVGRPSNKDLGSTKATTQAAHRLLIHVVEEYEEEPQIGLAFCEYLLATMDDSLQTVDELTMKNLIEMYAGLMQAMGISDEASASDAARDALLEPTKKYGHALRFASEKNLRPGMGFLNGRPVDGTDTNAISRAFGEEQQHIAGLIMKREITDTEPKSVYAKLLSGDKVFKKVHPLLFDKEGDSSSHLLLEHSLGPESLLFPDAKVENPRALFVAENIMSYSKEGGLEELRDFLNSLNFFPMTVETSDDKAPISVGYRVLPASGKDAQSPLCPILASASRFGVSNLVALIKRFEESGSTLTLDQLLADEKNTVDPMSCTSFGYLNDDWETKNMVIVNGRSYKPEGGRVSSDDLDLILDMEWPRARAVYESLQKFTFSDAKKTVDACGKVSAFLGAARGDSFQRTNILKTVLDLEQRGSRDQNSLRFRIPGAPSTESLLESNVVVVLDPISDAAQRVSSILELFKDSLGLTINVVLSPTLLIDGDSKVPITSYYRFVADTNAVDPADPVARFANLPSNHILTIRMDVPEPWDVQQTRAVQDTDNLRCDIVAGCSDASYESEETTSSTGLHLTSVEYGLSHLLIFGQCYEPSGSPPNGLQLTLTPYGQSSNQQNPTEVEIQADGTTSTGKSIEKPKLERFSDTLVMKTVGYWQLLANAGVWNIQIAEDSKGASMFDFVEAKVSGGRIKAKNASESRRKKIVMKDFVNRGDMLFVKRRPGFEKESLFYDVAEKGIESTANETINVFSLATGHLYERFLKIMMLSVTKRTSSKVKFWLFENFLSPTFKATAKAMAARIGCEVEFVTYKWPEWLRNQSEKQRIIWGYKILFLDVLFPLDVKKIIYVDADQVVRGDMKELWDMDLKGAPYGYTPFCSSRESTLGYQFWREGFWKAHLKGKPYHISALYVVDLETFRRTLVGDQLRATYQQLSADPNSLSNLDQDLPNYAQNAVPIFSLPQEWLWCESWCSEASKSTAKTIDLCNNPMHKEPKVSMAKRIISGPLFEESWVELDAEVEQYEKEYFETLATQ